MRFNAIGESYGARAGAIVDHKQTVRFPFRKPLVNLVAIHVTVNRLDEHRLVVKTQVIFPLVENYFYFGLYSEFRLVVLRFLYVLLEGPHSHSRAEIPACIDGRLLDHFKGIISEGGCRVAQLHCGNAQAQ
jgi:hypothetical protein